MLQDLLQPDLDIVFCGTAVGETSARREAYYAHPSNQFWDVLHRTGLTPRTLAPEEYPGLIEHGLGLTDLVKDQAGVDADVSFAAQGPDRLRKRLEIFEPGVLAFNGKRAAEEFLGRRSPDYGPQPERVGETGLWVLPSTSGAARGYWDESVWQDLAHRVRTADREVSASGTGRSR